MSPSAVPGRGQRAVAGGGLRSTILLWLVLTAVLTPFAARGFDRIGELQRLLREGPDYRVRLQAAFSLGRTPDPRSVRALEHSLLEDDHPAVRAACAAALARVGAVTALGSLQRALRDRSASVRVAAEQAILALRGSAEIPTRWDRVRYVVGVGQLANRSSVRGDEMSRKFKGLMERELRQDIHFAVRPEGSEGAAFDSNARRRRLPSFWLEGTIGSLRRAPGTGIVNVRCEISLMVLTHPDRNLRMMLSSSGVAQERERLFSPLAERRMQEQALESAVRGAVSRLARTLADSPNVAQR